MHIPQGRHTHHGSFLCARYHGILCTKIALADSSFHHFEQHTGAKAAESVIVSSDETSNEGDEDGRETSPRHDNGNDDGSSNAVSYTVYAVCMTFSLYVAAVSR